MTSRRHLSDALLIVAARRPERALGARDAQHLAECSRCRSLLSRFRAVHASVNDSAPGPGRSALVAVLGLAEPRPSDRRHARRVAIARLLHDTGPRQMAGGLRAGSETREQLWRIPGADVDVRIEPAGLGSAGVLHGQLFPLGHGVGALADGSVWLVQRGNRAAWAPLGQEGEFELPAPSVPRWTLWLEWRGMRARLDVR